MWSFVSSVGFWEFLEYSFEILVIFGCAGEAIGEFTNVWNIRNEPRRKDRLLKISTIVLLIGLAGALISTARTNVIAGETIEELDNKAKDAIADSKTAMGDAVEAKRESGDALQSASDAATAATGAKVKTDSFEEEISKAEGDATKAEQHLAEALRKAETAEREAEEIITKFADRELTDTQASEIASELKSYAGQEWELITYWQDREPAKLANRLLSILSGPQGARWKYVKFDVWHGLLGGEKGVNVWRKPDANPATQHAAAALVSALLKQGIAATLNVASGSPDAPKESNRITVNIGTKPM